MEELLDKIYYKYKCSILLIEKMQSLEFDTRKHAESGRKPTRHTRHPSDEPKFDPRKHAGVECVMCSGTAKFKEEGTVGKKFCSQQCQIVYYNQ